VETGSAVEEVAARLIQNPEVETGSAVEEVAARLIQNPEVETGSAVEEVAARPIQNPEVKTGSAVEEVAARPIQNPEVKTGSAVEEVAARPIQNPEVKTGSAVEEVAARPIQNPELELIPEFRFFTFSGRRAVWADGWRLFTDSPVLGYGFQADRLLLGTHMHNSVMQTLLQTGVLGTIPFILAIGLAWISILQIFLKLKTLTLSDKHLVIQCAGILAFFTMRSFPESTGAFFGVDWLMIAVILFYLQAVHFKITSPERGSD
jgi:hypothetical protein